VQCRRRSRRDASDKYLKSDEASHLASEKGAAGGDTNGGGGGAIQRGEDFERLPISGGKAGKAGAAPRMGAPARPGASPRRGSGAAAAAAAAGAGGALGALVGGKRKVRRVLAGRTPAVLACMHHAAHMVLA
jgi:hypothetical protein